MADQTSEKAIEYEDEPAPEAAPAPVAEAPVKPAVLPPEPTPGGIPAWCRVPEGLRVPRGRVVEFIRIPSAWTDAPGRGQALPVEDAGAIAIAGPGALWRTAVCWPLDMGDEKHAIGRSMSDTNRFAGELVKQFIRCVDGNLADWSGEMSAGNIDTWWNEIGGRNRRLIQGIWNRLHTHSSAATVAFFEHCVVARLPG